MIRHARAERFERARLTVDTTAERWHDLDDDPNDPMPLAHRAHTLRAAWRPQVADRIAFLEDRCRNRVVLDIGCVAHAESRLQSGDWLHGRLAAVAARCLGVDILEAGVAAVVQAGYDAIVHDLTGELGPLESWAPFDVIVAGELLEHVHDLDMIFKVATESLSEVGQLIVTTPNPYAPERVRAGQRGIIYENTDHVSYLFPSGIAELAERRGLELQEAMTTEPRRGPSASLVRRLKRTIKGSHWRAVGFGADGQQARVELHPLRRTLHRALHRDTRFVGETAIYVIGRPKA